MIWFLLFCVYDEPSADLCLHKDLHLANVHHLAVKRDGVVKRSKIFLQASLHRLSDLLTLVSSFYL